ncbi:DUF5615 family PIN-like protein [Microbacterium barkeri]
MRLVRWLREQGVDAVHSSELPGGNHSTDHSIARLADREDRIVVTKDADFVTSNVLEGTPRRLLVVRTGNVRNAELVALFQAHFAEIAAALERHSVVELHRTHLRVSD